MAGQVLVIDAFGFMRQKGWMNIAKILATVAFVVMLACESQKASPDGGNQDVLLQDTMADATTVDGASSDVVQDAPPDVSVDAPNDTPGSAFTLSSSAFVEGGTIPSRPYTCAVGSFPDGTSPPLSWSNPPPGTQSFALLMIDTNNNFQHWAVFDIPASTTQFAMGAVPSGAIEGSSSGRTQYIGPCPPSGVHRYRFRLYALNVESLGFARGASYASIEAAATSASLGIAAVTGTVSNSDI